jgi:hypothetical protein
LIATQFIAEYMELDIVPGAGANEHVVVTHDAVGNGVRDEPGRLFLLFILSFWLTLAVFRKFDMSS